MQRLFTAPTAEPFRQPFPIRSIDDVLRIEQTPIEETIRPQSTYEIFCNSAAAFGDKVALRFLSALDPEVPPTTLSYSALLCEIHRTANLLHRLGVGPDDSVAVMLPGCLEYHLALWGGAAAGIVFPLNPLLTVEKLAVLMNAAHSKVLIAWGDPDDAGIWSKSQQLRELVPSLRTIVRVSQSDGTQSLHDVAQDGVLSFATRVHEQAVSLESGRKIARDNVASYFHTGGTTGAPKLARHSHGAQVFTAWACVTMNGIRSADTLINGFPLFHVAGALSSSLAPLSAGAELVIPTTRLMRNPDVVANYWRLVERHRATILSGVPTVLAALANVPVDGADITSLRYCRSGAAILPAELADRFQRLLGLHVHESFGMTEMAGISTITPPGVKAPPGCVGFRLPYTKVRIAALGEAGEATDEEVVEGAPGVILFKSPNLFSGYLGEHGPSKSFHSDGWLSTGDIGWMDGQQRLYLSGRSKDLIIRSGHNIDPRIIEDALSAHPAVQLCAAVGAPDAYAGEIPVAFVTLRPGACAEEAELLDFIADKVDEAPAKPKWVAVLDQMPVTNVGKIFKPDLRAFAARRVLEFHVLMACKELDIAPPHMPSIVHRSDGSFVVTIDATQTGGVAESLAEKLSRTAGRLPIRMQLEVKQLRS